MLYEESEEEGENSALLPKGDDRNDDVTWGPDCKSKGSIIDSDAYPSDGNKGDLEDGSRIPTKRGFRENPDQINLTCLEEEDQRLSKISSQLDDKTESEIEKNLQGACGIDKKGQARAEKCTVDERKSNLTDEEIIELYKERNRFRRWSQPCWKIGIDEAGKEEGKERKDRMIVAENNEIRKASKTIEDKRKEGKILALNETRLEESNETNNIYIGDRSNGERQQSSDKLSERLKLNMNKDGNEDVRDSKEDLVQQWIAGKRKSIPATPYCSSSTENSDERLSDSVSLNENRMNKEPREGEKQNEMANPIIYFNYDANTSKKFSTDSTTKDEIVYIRNEDYLDIPEFNVNNRDVVTSKTDDMLQG